MKHYKRILWEADYNNFVDCRELIESYPAFRGYAVRFMPHLRKQTFFYFRRWIKR